MALPPVQEIEDNTGGVLRLKDGTPLPPYLAMPRGLPLPDWYAMHRPRQAATLAMLAQLLYRLEKLHVSGYCHNDIKPANMVLLDGGNKKKPEWHIVDFTNMSQIGVHPLLCYACSPEHVWHSGNHPDRLHVAQNILLFCLHDGGILTAGSVAGSNTRARYTLEYASPEVIRAVGAMRAHYVTCQPSMDVWSMGVICFEVLTSKPFFPMDYNREAMKDGLIGLEPLPVEEEPALFSKIPAEGKLRATVKMMLSRDTEKRPSAAMVGKAVADCLKELTGEAPEPMDGSPVSSLLRDESTAGI